MGDAAAIAVKSTTGVWTAAGVWALVFMLVASIAIAIIKIAPRWRELGIGGEAALRAQLAERIETLEGRLDAQEKRRDAQEKRHDTHIEIVRQLHDAEIAILRHRLAGEEQVNLALMTLMSAANVPEAALKAIEDTRLRKEEAIAQERAALTTLRADAIQKIEALRKGDAA